MTEQGGSDMGRGDTGEGGVPKGGREGRITRHEKRNEANLLKTIS